MEGYKEKQFDSKKLEMPGFLAKMHLKSTPQKLNFSMTKTIKNSYTRL